MYRRLFDKHASCQVIKYFLSIYQFAVWLTENRNRFVTYHHWANKQP